MNIIATPKGGTHVAGFERALTKAFTTALEGTRLLKAGEEIVKDDVLEGMTVGRHRTAGRAAVRGPDQGGARHPAGRGSVAKVVNRELTAFLTSTKARHEGAGAGGAGEGRRRVPRPGGGPSAPGGAAPQERAGVVVAAGQAGRLPQQRRRPHRAVHRRGRLGHGHGQARPELGVPGAAADPRQDPQRAEGVGRATCSRTPSAPRSSRWSAPAPAGPSTWTRPATARSSSWPTPTPTAPTSAACWPRCSSATCGRWSTRAGSSPRCRRCTGSS